MVLSRLTFSADKVGQGKENGGVDPPSANDVNWESHLDSALLEQSRKKILQTLNSGSLKDLKSLQLIGDKKAKLIMGWREIHGDFTQVYVWLFTCDVQNYDMRLI